jgi:phosphotransacetylase
LLSHSNFGSSNHPSAVKMRDTLALLRQNTPWLEVDGEMHGDAALDADHRRGLMPMSTLTGEANLLVLPNIDAANIAYNLLKTAAGGGIAIGPLLLGAAKVCTGSMDGARWMEGPRRSVGRHRPCKIYKDRTYYKSRSINVSL